jgi:hypothetical protein
VRGSSSNRPPPYLRFIYYRTGGIMLWLQIQAEDTAFGIIFL